MVWRFATASDIGGREEQQDRVDIIESPDRAGYLVVVADGMGGYTGGALAAQAVIDSAKRFFETADMSDPLPSLGKLCAQAHDAVMDLDARSDQPPGSTCVLLYLTDEDAYWAHVGDSRLYHFRNGKLLARTLDHSMVQLLVSRGEMAEEDMAISPLQNQLYMRLGGKQQPSPEYGAAEVQKGDLFMLCSDGLWETVYPEEVRTAMSNNDLAAAGEHLVQLAKSRGGSNGDNITLAMAQPGKAQKRFRLFS